MKRDSSLLVAAPIRDLINVADGSLTFEDLLSVLLGFALSQFTTTKIRTGRKEVRGTDAYPSEHGTPGFLRVPNNFLFPRRGVYDHARCCAITGLSRTYKRHV